MTSHQLILTLVLSSAAMHAVWNVMVRSTADRDAAIFNIALVSLVCAWIYFLAFEGFGPPVTAWGMFYCAGSGLFEVGYLVALAKAYHAGPVGPAYAISRGAAPLVLLPFSIVWMGERPSVSAVLSMLLVAAGVFLLGSRKSPSPAPAPLVTDAPPTGAAPPASRPLIYFFAAFAAAAFIAAFNGCYQLCGMEHIGPAARYCYSITMTLPFQLLFLHNHPPGSPEASAGRPAKSMAFRRIAVAFRQYPWQSIAGGIICGVSFLMFLVALDLGRQPTSGIGVGALTSLRTLAIPVTALIALIVLKEKLSARDWLGITIVTSGIIALSYFSASGH